MSSCLARPTCHVSIPHQWGAPHSLRNAGLANENIWLATAMVKDGH